jgi:hypothetical protein
LNFESGDDDRKPAGKKAKVKLLVQLKIDAHTFDPYLQLKDCLPQKGCQR